MPIVNLRQQLDAIAEPWQLKTVAEFNGQQVKLVKLAGEYVWHSHEGEDKLFMVVQGHLQIELRDRSLLIKEGEFTVIPRGLEHKPVAQTDEVWLMMIEPASIGEAQ